MTDQNTGPSDVERANHATYENLFASDGWKLFITDLQEDFDAADSVYGLRDANEFQERKGVLDAMHQILNLEHIKTLAWEQATEGDEL